MLSGSGLVSQKDYEQVHSLKIYQELEAYSDTFLAKNQALIQSYARSWVRDPFHQWSRQWEFPWVAHHLDHLPKDENTRVLDAGSGLTFFPFFLAAQAPDRQIICVDGDVRLEKAYQQLTREVPPQPPTFQSSDLRSLPFTDQSFDGLYCISVLEHTKGLEQIVREFHRVLKPGAVALITFDIGLNRVAELSPQRVEGLLETLGRTFSLDPVATDFWRSDLVTTEWIRRHHPSSLPWRYPWLSAWKASLRFGRYRSNINLTFMTLKMSKRI